MLQIIPSLIAAAFAIWAMVDVAQNQMTKQQKIAWFAAVVLVPIIGPILYYIFRKNRTLNQ